jgi:hypothetical protein
MLINIFAISTGTAVVVMNLTSSIRRGIATEPYCRGFNAPKNFIERLNTQLKRKV